MVSEYKVPPTEKHYVCMVDLLARAGGVEEACELIDSMNAESGLLFGLLSWQVAVKMASR